MPGRRLPAALLVLWMGSAVAGAFAVNPVRLALGKGRSASAMTVHNQGAEPAVIQIEALDWSQQDGAEVLGPTLDLIATPPIFKLAAGASQIVRVGLRGPAPDPRREVAYRLLLKEVVPPPAPGTQGVQVTLNISLPVFIEPASARPSLRWQARYEAGQLRLTAFNEGNVHVQVTGLGLPDVARQPDIKPAYLLQGQQREWRFATDTAPTGPLRLVARTDAGETTTNLALMAP